jgi:hypothetical protein
VVVVQQNRRKWIVCGVLVAAFGYAATQVQALTFAMNLASFTTVQNSLIEDKKEVQPIDKKPVSTDKPPPYEIPLFDGKKDRTKQQPEHEYEKANVPNGRALYALALDCWPTASYFRAELSAEGRIRNGNGAVLSDTNSIDQGGRNSAAIVLRVPLYSAAELDREREREYMRRTKVADAVGDLISAVSDRQRVNRELMLMRSLEKRSQERVRIGVAETSEQVKYLEKVADLEGALIKHRGTLEKARLALIGLCATQHADRVDNYVSSFIGHQ